MLIINWVFTFFISLWYRLIESHLDKPKNIQQQKIVHIKFQLLWTSASIEFWNNFFFEKNFVSRILSSFWSNIKQVVILPSKLVAKLTELSILKNPSSFAPPLENHVKSYKMNPFSKFATMFLEYVHLASTQSQLKNFQWSNSFNSRVSLHIWRIKRFFNWLDTL